MPRHIAELPTPALLLDLEILRANVASMASRMRGAGVALRPHVKTHKSVEIARLQHAEGAAGFTVATLQEAEAMAAAGFRDLLLAFPPVGAWRLARLEQLLERARVTFLVDGAEVARTLGDAGRRLGESLPCLWEVDCGARRCGTPPGESTVATAERALDEGGLELAGFLTFPGHAYAARDDRELAAAVTAENDALRRTRSAAGRAGLTAPIMSGGTTPTAWCLAPKSVLTEARPGNYVFHDATQVALGVIGYGGCALTVAATVVARPTPERIVVDAGSKALGREQMTPRTRGFATVAGRPELSVTGLYEEHGVIEASEGADLSDLGVGARVEIVPNHACVAANLHATYVLRRGDEVLDAIALDARGWS